MDAWNELGRKVRTLAKEFRDNSEFGKDADTIVGWHILILKEIEQLKSEIETAQKKADKIEAVQRQMDEINQKLDQIKILQHGQIKQTDLVQEVEQQFDGKSIAEILKENKNLSIRALAKKLNVGKSTIAQWRKKILSATGGR